MTQATVPPPHLTLSGADPRLPEWPQEQTPVDDPYAEVEIKAQLKPRAVWLRKRSESLSVMSDSSQPHGLYSPWNSPSQKLTVSSLSLLSGDLPNPGIKSRSLTLQVDSLPAEPQGKAKNTGVCSLSLLQRIFLTQELNRGLLHCRQIL